MRQKTVYPKGTNITVKALSDGRIEVISNAPPHKPEKNRLATPEKSENNARDTGSLGNQPGAKG